MGFPVFLAWVFVFAFCLVHFLGTLPYFFKFEEADRLAADCLLYGGALIVGFSLLLWRGLAPFRLASRSTLLPFFLAVVFVQIISALVNSPATALQAITVDLAYGIWIVGAMTLWDADQRPLFALVLGSLILTVSCNLFHAFEWFGGHLSDQLTFFSLGALVKSSFWHGTFNYPFYNSNYTAAFLLPIFAGLWGAHFSSWKKVPWWLLTLSLLSVFWCGSKASYLILGIALLICFLIRVFTFRVALTVSFVIFFFLWLGLYSTQKFDFFTNTQKPGYRLLENFVYDKSAGTRVLIWSGVWRAVIGAQEGPLTPFEEAEVEFPGLRQWQHRLLGYGPGNYVFKSAAFRQPQYYAGSYSSDYTMHPHSSLFSFLADTGILGFVVWCLLFFQVFHLAVRLTLLRQKEGQQAWMLLVVAGFLAFHSFFTAAAQYPVHRLHWVILLGGLITLELKHRRLKLADERAWPQEFSGPAHAIVVGLVLVLCLKGFYVLEQRWLSFRALQKNLVDFGRWKTYEENKSTAKRVPKKITPTQLNQIFSRVESNLLASPGRDWVNLNTVKTLKVLALSRENFVAWAQARDIENIDLRKKWRAQGLMNLETALRQAPDFTDLSRLYGEIIWKMTTEAERFGMKILSLGTRQLTLPEARQEAIACLHHALLKGGHDYHIFDALLSYPLFIPLRKIFSQAIAQHAINDPFFKRRLLAGADIDDSLKKAWIRWQLRLGPRDQIKTVLLVVEPYLKKQSVGQRWSWAHLFVTDILSRSGESIDPSVWKILFWGGPSPESKRRHYLSLTPLRRGWVTEIMRSCLFNNFEKTRQNLKGLLVGYPSAKLEDFIRFIDASEGYFSQFVGDRGSDIILPSNP